MMESVISNDQLIDFFKKKLLIDINYFYEARNRLIIIDYNEKSGTKSTPGKDQMMVCFSNPP